MNVVVRALFVVLLYCPLFAVAEDKTDESSDVSVAYQYALYYLGEVEQDAFVQAAKTINRRFSDFVISTDFSKKPIQPTIYMGLIRDVKNQYAPPDVESIGYFGHGLSRKQAEQVQNANGALVLNFVFPLKDLFKAQYQSQQIMDVLADDKDALIWDEETREIFTPDAWQSWRIDSWENGIPYMSKQTVIHAYNTGEYVRAITLGMAKFALPDVVINDISWAQNSSAGNLINLVAQSFVEGNIFDEKMTMELNVEQILHPEFREYMLASLYDNAHPQVKLKFKPARAEEGDPDNYLIQISFDHIKGNTNQERQDVLFNSLFGYVDEVTQVRHNDEILAASARAKEALPGLKQDFLKGLEPGEYISLKAPFETANGGTEWMWVEVMRWQGDDITGLLRNEPQNVPGLRGGSTVKINQQDIFDYLREFPDGTSKGNETGRLIQKYFSR